MKDTNFWSVVANLVICIIGIIQSIVFYKINKKNSYKNSLFLDLCQSLTDCENYSSHYWCTNLKVDERIRIAESLKSSIKKARSTLKLLGKKYIEKDIIIDLQNDFGEIDKQMTGGTFETKSFTIDSGRHQRGCDLLVKFRESIISLLNK